MRVYALTTVDNPYSYFQERDEWEGYENSTGNRATKMVGRFAKTSDQLSVIENELEMKRAIDDIIKYDPFGIYIREVSELNEDEIWS